ncbi:hypothetical protein FNV43_RR06165 [Rhamnella rubrinervis]|uniref:Uncharacterized protein n=1 Tax=Rhamnella rubrinervis TaxID=2594499 RepID=A0A8K0HD23_9ROSA|nr:hypothetical protein FNV43_RR06165 [Rhamnella rubrinervis]
MAKSMRSKREKRLRAIRREIIEPLYEKKDVAKLAAQEAALAAPKLPVKPTPGTTSAMEVTSINTSVAETDNLDVEMADGNQSVGFLKLVGGVGKKSKRQFKVGKRRRHGKGKSKGKVMPLISCTLFGVSPLVIWKWKFGFSVLLKVFNQKMRATEKRLPCKWTDQLPSEADSQMEFFQFYPTDSSDLKRSRKTNFEEWCEKVCSSRHRKFLTFAALQSFWEFYQLDDSWTDSIFLILRDSICYRAPIGFVPSKIKANQHCQISKRRTKLPFNVVVPGENNRNELRDPIDAGTLPDKLLFVVSNTPKDGKYIQFFWEFSGPVIVLQSKISKPL